MAVQFEIDASLKGADQLVQRIASVRQEVTRLQTATKVSGELPLSTQQQLARMDQAISKTGALRERVAAVRKELQTTGTSRLLELAEAESKDALVDVERLNASVKELRDNLESPVDNRVANAVQNVGAPRRPGTAAPAATSLNDRTFGQLAGAATALNIPGGGALRTVADIADVTENLPKLGAEIKALGVAGVASTAAVGAVAIAMFALDKALDDGAKSARKTIEAIEQESAARKKSREDLRTLTAAAAQQQRDDLQQDIVDARLDLQELDAERDKARTERRDVNHDALQFSAKDYLAGVKEQFAGDFAAIGERIGINAGALGELNTAIDEHNKNLADQQKELERILAVERELASIEAGRTDAGIFLEALDKAGEGLIQTGRDIQTLNSEELRERASEAEQRRTIAQQNREATQAEITRLRGIYEGASEDEQTRILASLETLKTASAGYTATIDTETTEITRLTTVVQPLVAQREREAGAIERLTALQEQAAQQAERAADSLQKFTGAQQALADFEGQLATDELNARREASINAIYDAQLNAIDADIEAAKAADKQAQAQQKLVEAQANYTEKVQDTNQQFFQQELDRLAQFRKEEARINDDFAREQRRRLEDLNDDLLDAVANNDVVSFVERQKEGSKEIARAAEDFGVDAVRRTEDFNSETAQNQRDHLQELLNVNRQYYEQRQQLTVAAGGQELSLLDQLQARRAEIIANRELSLQQLRDQLEQEGINRRRQTLIANMNAAQEEYKRLNELATTSGRIIGSNFMMSIIGGMSQAKQALSAVQDFGNSIRIPSFAGGGDVNRPTLAMVGDMKPPFDAERIIPYRRSDGYGLPGGGRGAGIVNNFDFSGTNFGNLSRSEVVSIVDGSVNSAMWKLTGIVEGHAS